MSFFRRVIRRLSGGREAPEPAQGPTLLDALARAPAAAALVVAALDRLEDRRALRLAHPQMRDAVGEATTKLDVIVPGSAAAARPPTPARWPRLEELRIFNPNLAAFEALGSAAWANLLSLRIECPTYLGARLGAPAARALAAALRRMPALRALQLRHMRLPDAAASELFWTSSAEAAPHLRSLSIRGADLTPAAARALAATGWRLEALDLAASNSLGAAGLAALLAAPTFALRRLGLQQCNLDAAALLSVANAPWPLEELDLSDNDLGSAAAGPVLTALLQHEGLRKLNVGYCKLSAAIFKALVEAAWPALTSLSARWAKVEFDGPHALGAAAFAGFPALEELDLAYVELGEAGAALLASRRWARLKKLNLVYSRLGFAGVAALARGGWPALEELNLRDNQLGAPLTLQDARRWAPALEELIQWFD